MKLEERAEQHRHTRDATEENISRELAGLNEELKVSGGRRDVYVCWLSGAQVQS